MPSRPLQALVCGLGLWLCEVVVETLLSEVVEAWLEGVGGIRNVAVLAALFVGAFGMWWIMHKVEPGNGSADATAAAATPEVAHQVGEVTLCHTCLDQIKIKNKKSLKVDISSIDTQEFHTPLPYKTPSVDKVEAILIENPKEFLDESKAEEENVEAVLIQNPQEFLDEIKAKEKNVCETCTDNNNDPPRATMAGLLTINDSDYESHDQTPSGESTKEVEVIENTAARIDRNNSYEHAKMIEIPIEVKREKCCVEIPIIRVDKVKVETEPL